MTESSELRPTAYRTDYNPFQDGAINCSLTTGIPPPEKTLAVKGLVQGDLTIPLGVG